MKNIRILALLGLLFCFNPLFAQKQWQIQTSAVTFKIKNAGLTVDGAFGTVTATILFDKNNVEDTKIEASLETKTIDTGITSRDNHLKKPDYFDVIKYPKISMKSKKITKLADGSYEGIFDLTLKGVTKEIKIPFTFIENPNSATFTGQFTINRRDYGVGGSSWIMSDNATIKIVLTVN
ncbi:MAG: YceI family protein [Thermoflexibacter sp.]|jgi:polyisoprenoid-binding protein YceI|nr:YceI family protein [Thermoflexibacter sp.]